MFNNDPNFRKLVRRVSMMCLLPKEYISPGVVDHVFKLYEDTLEDAHNIKREDNIIKKYDLVTIDKSNYIVIGDDETRFYVVDKDDHMYYIEYQS